MTKELLNLIRKQKSLHRRIFKSAHKNSELIARHRALRNKTNNLYRRLRNSHFKDRLLLHRTSPRQLWTTIKYITNKQRLPLQVPVPLNDLLSRYFERLLQQPGEYITLPYGPNNINSLQTFVPVTPTESEGLLSQLIPRKSPGPDMISPFELKMVKQQLSTQLSIIFNESLATGVLSAEFKTGNISPILKPGKTDNSAPNSYRGISLTCVLAKVLEKIVHQQLEAHFHKIGAYHEDQYGFKKRRSCADLLLATIDDWLIAKDHKMSTSVVFIDRSKAFDNVRHDKLLIKLQKRVSGTVHAEVDPQLLTQQNAESCCWKSQFSFILLHQGCSSRKCSQSSSVQHLRVWFAQYGKGRTTVPSVHLHTTWLSTTLTPQQSKPQKLSVPLLNIINDELVDLGLPINVEKSATLLIYPSAKKSNHLPSTPPILLCGTPVNVVTEMRLLGVIVDNQLSWSSQVNSVISKVSQKIGILRRNIHQLSPSARRPFLPGSHSTGPWVCSYSNDIFHVHFFAWSHLFCVEAGSALCRRGGLASRSCHHFEKSSFNVNRTSLGTPVCCCCAKMCSKISSSLSVHKTKFYRTFSSNQGKRKFSSTILSLLSARHALIH